LSPDGFVSGGTSIQAGVPPRDLPYATQKPAWGEAGVIFREGMDL